MLDAPVHGITELPLHFVLNGRPHTLRVPVERTLADLLHDELGMAGTKLGCSRGVCGACVALIEGKPVASCSTFAFQVDGLEVRTIEGLAQDGMLHAVQHAFIDRSAFQCGYCTAGMVLLAVALLEHHPLPDRATIVEWISSNVCRCTGYTLIIEAVELAAQRLREAAKVPAA